MNHHRKTVLFLLTLTISLLAFLLSHFFLQPQRSLAVSPLLAPAPTQPLGDYDYFGQLLSPQAAAELVQRKGLDPNNPVSYQRIGAVQITQQLIDQGEKIFLDRKIGDNFGFQRVFGFSAGLAKILPELTVAVLKQGGRPTNNLVIALQKDITLAGQTFPKGTKFPTGLNLERGALLPIGLKLPGEISCAICHVELTPQGNRLKGVPNGDLAIPFFIALAPNSAAGFARLTFNPLDPQYQGNGKTIIDSTGKLVQLPDPQKFEDAFDRAVLAVPFGHFESSPDSIDNTTQIPAIFTFKTGPYTAGGEFAVGPFAGLSAITNGVNSSEVNLLAAAQQSAATIGIDREVYLGTVLQNAADPRLRLPAGAPVKPSEWLRKVAPDALNAELADQVAVPGAGSYPNLKLSLFSYNGLVFSPNTRKPGDIARGPFLFANNAMSAWQNSLVPPANQTSENRIALQTGSVERGAQIFEQAQCLSCHKAPYFTDNITHPIAEIRTNPARAASRLAQNALLVPPKLYAFNTPVPIPSNAEVIDVPTAGIADTPTTLPKGLLPDGGYKTPSLLGLYLTPPYLHDGGAAVRQGTLQATPEGNFVVADATGLGLSGTLSRGIPAEAAGSLRALLDRSLRAQVIAANQANPALVLSNLDGTGHEFYVDAAAGYAPSQQTDLINFLLALDDNPGSF
jgi:mono/diheme cytochrome c family protein